MKYLLALAALLCAVHSWAAPGISPDCAQYEWTIARYAFAKLGPTAPVAAFAAQVMQESSCNKNARSGVGAQGLTQFMPETATWMRELDSSLAPARPMDPEWAIKALVAYDVWLAKRNKGRTECDTYAFALSSYNGGEGWVHRDQAVTRSRGFDALVWFGVVELNPDPRRSPVAIKENRGYPARILLTLQPRFVSVGWGRPIVCKLE
jgi:soluble lytic murein transglycosylase-like protein